MAPRSLSSLRLATSAALACALALPLSTAPQALAQNANPSSNQLVDVDYSSLRLINNDGEKQWTGAFVFNASEATVLSVTDENGTVIPSEIDDSGNINVTADATVDGPFLVTVSDPRIDGGSVEFTLAVKGHKEGFNDDIRLVDTTINTLVATGEEQFTGAYVLNQNPSTGVAAMDSEGEDIPARLAADGKIYLSPTAAGTVNLEVFDTEDEAVTLGLIDVVVTEAPTEAPAPAPTPAEPAPAEPAEPAVPADQVSVDYSSLRLINNDGEKQWTGAYVHKASAATAVVVTDENGTVIPSEIDDSGNINVTAGATVDGPFKVVVTDPALEGGKVEFTLAVKGHQEGVNDDIRLVATDVAELSANGEEQFTGAYVLNANSTTGVNAMDSEGEDVPARLAADGKIYLSPATAGSVYVEVIDGALPAGTAGNFNVEVKAVPAPAEPAPAPAEPVPAPAPAQPAAGFWAPVFAVASYVLAPVFSLLSFIFGLFRR